MENFKSIINKYVKMTSNQNDKRIIQEALNLINSESTILENEFDILNEIFIYLKKDYTINIIQDPTNLDFCLAIIKQQNPFIKNKHELNSLVCELKLYLLNKNINKIENTVLNFLDASEHIEENEILLIQNIIRYLNNEWILKPFENQKYLGEEIKISRLIPTYSKKLTKNI